MQIGEDSSPVSRILPWSSETSTTPESLTRNRDRRMTICIEEKEEEEDEEDDLIKSSEHNLSDDQKIMTRKKPEIDKTTRQQQQQTLTSPPPSSKPSSSPLRFPSRQEAFPCNKESLYSRGSVKDGNRACSEQRDNNSINGNGGETQKAIFNGEDRKREVS